MAKRSTQIQKLLRQIGKEDIFPPNRKSRTVEPKKPNRPTFKKGIPAALMMSNVQASLRTMARNTNDLKISNSTKYFSNEKSSILLIAGKYLFKSSIDNPSLDSIGFLNKGSFLSIDIVKI